MDVFILGAGRPAYGTKPAALKNIALNSRAMDWQIHSFDTVTTPNNIHFLGGYHIDKVIESYPFLNFTVVADWQKKSLLHTFLSAPFGCKPIITCYSDTVFRKEVIKDITTVEADIVVGIDSIWRSRYADRTQLDIDGAETLDIPLANQAGLETVEFTGLVHFKQSVAQRLSQLDEAEAGNDLMSLIRQLESLGYSVAYFDVKGEWAEFNSPRDIAHFILGTKAETLARLEPLVQKSHIGKQVSFTTSQWYDDKASILTSVQSLFGNTQLVIRSSSKGEDNWYASNAGGFESILNVDSNCRETVTAAVDEVIASYGEGSCNNDQVLIQQQLTEVSASGVVFTCNLETGAPYYRFNFDDKTQSTESVTSGGSGDLRTVILSRGHEQHLYTVEPALSPVLSAIKELELLLGYDKLDIEFAIDTRGLVHIFQVRPVTIDHSAYDLDSNEISYQRAACEAYFTDHNLPQHNILGDKAIYANMPDWNPAEIIGTKPKTLAFSLYRQLITNDVWAMQRAEFGYRDVRPAPLINAFAGQPYVDARASLNSFIPASLSHDSANCITNAYLNILSENPHFHDKIEFDVAFTVWTPDFSDNASARLTPYKVTPAMISELELGLKDITRKALARLDNDTASIATLRQQNKDICSGNQSALNKGYALLEVCREYGTLAFSHAARAGFVATTLLNSFVATGALSEQRRSEFLKSFNTVAGDFELAKSALASGKINLPELISTYGHLRPGTYEISTQAYWEDPERYLYSAHNTSTHDSANFLFRQDELCSLKGFLDKLGSAISVEQLIAYLISAIQSRESVKFDFSKSLSLALDYIVSAGAEAGISRTDLSFFDFNDIESLKLNTLQWRSIPAIIAQRKAEYAITSSVELPSFIQSVSDFYCFERFSSLPNYITTEKAVAEVICYSATVEQDLNGKIVMITQADPGYDWLFGHGIAGLITQYGGANSHMAIRAAEIGLPAAIGVGDKLFDKISTMQRIEIDCSGQTIRKVI
ncbi:hypothetical protein SIN8267_02130 [Sinobacterium norvegicum]|uniref:PEP-utilising enzyme mobile domain-containing protein n=1 Tax=Sinobacterium norvegicum TaxID=1641715 RepID=A0ABN8EI15_9GAMM|nr:PEP-utilizing enzyme [Sinobacterium norvegicum]CAH0992015.1 hypothetical protein SIN8267_02130 [Sinobacterium norvegicum]